MIGSEVPKSIKVNGDILSRRSISTGKGAKKSLKKEGRKATKGRFGPQKYRVKKFKNVESPYFEGKKTVWALYTG